MAKERTPVSSGETSQTLDRGLTVLSLLARHTDGLTAAELADRLSTARAVVYRLLRTLEAHRLITRTDNRFVLGFGIAELASRLRPRLQSTVLPILRELSARTSSTATLSIADRDQAVVLMTEEPPESTLHLAMREGSRHPLEIGSDGIAILSQRIAHSSDSTDVKRARRLGYALSIGAIQPGAVGVAAPLHTVDGTEASIGIVRSGTAIEGDAIPKAVMEAAVEASRRLSGGRDTSTAD